MTTVIVACSGPSLSLVDPMAEPHAVAAVSTAIRTVTLPHVWISCDGTKRKEHGLEGEAAMRDPRVRKIIPDYRQRRLVFGSWPNVEFVRFDKLKIPRWYDPNCYHKDPNLTIVLAIQWLVAEGGFKTLVFAGMDLRSTPRHAHAHDGPIMPAKSLQRHQSGHNKVLKLLPTLQREAAERFGCMFLSWTPGSPINDFMEPYRGPVTVPPPSRRQPAQPAARMGPDRPRSGGPVQRLEGLVEQVAAPGAGPADARG